MASHVRDCPAGGTVALPPTPRGTVVFSVIVVPCPGAGVAPVEVGVGLLSNRPSTAVELVPMLEGSAFWSDDSSVLLCKVPDWMCGTMLIRGPRQGPAVGAVVSIRTAGPSVVYALVEESLNGRPGRSGGLLPTALPGSGWEPRHQAPEVAGGSKLAVFARRAVAREAIAVSPFSEEGAIFALVVKVDVEAFDATAITSNGFEYSRVRMAETALAWSDTRHRWAWVPSYLTGGILLKGPHNSTPSGTVIRLIATAAFRAYCIFEVKHKNRAPRTGGFLESLPEQGWQQERAAPSWESASTMQIFSKRVSEGRELLLPPTSGAIIFSLVAVSLDTGPDRLAEELKRAFLAWDTQSRGGISKPALKSILQALCPKLGHEDLEKLLCWADQYGTGIVPYEEFISRVVLGSTSS